MQSIKSSAMSGYNETLQTIQSAQKKHAGKQEHFVTLVVFDSNATRTIYKSTPCQNAKELCKETYTPNGMTPLYDAMGTTLRGMQQSLKGQKDYKVLVSIITDGEENSSKEYTGAAIKKLVDELKEQAWVFTYIGANQDVEKVAATIGVRNTLKFQASPEATKAMFKRENVSREKWFDREAKGASAQELQDDYFEEPKKEPSPPPAPKKR